MKLYCTACGATAQAGCECGVAYMPRARAAAAVVATPDKSARAIAAEIGVGHATVSRARKQLSHGETVAKHTGRDNRTRRMPKPKEQTTVGRKGKSLAEFVKLGRKYRRIKARKPRDVPWHDYAAKHCDGYHPSHVDQLISIADGGEEALTRLRRMKRDSAAARVFNRRSDLPDWVQFHVHHADPAICVGAIKYLIRRAGLACAKGLPTLVPVYLSELRECIDELEAEVKAQQGGSNGKAVNHSNGQHGARA